MSLDEWIFTCESSEKYLKVLKYQSTEVPFLWFLNANVTMLHFRNHGILLIVRCHFFVLMQCRLFAYLLFSIFSQLGNIIFPVREHFIPSEGTFYSQWGNNSYPSWKLQFTLTIATSILSLMCRWLIALLSTKIR